MDVEKLENKIDKMLDIQMEMSKSQVRMEADIEHHIMRTGQLEEYIQKVTNRLAVLESDSNKKITSLTLEIESAKRTIKAFAGAIALFHIIMQLMGKLA